MDAASTRPRPRRFDADLRRIGALLAGGALASLAVLPVGRTLAPRVALPRARSASR